MPKITVSLCEVPSYLARNPSCMVAGRLALKNMFDSSWSSTPLETQGPNEKFLNILSLTDFGHGSASIS
jgi:hypothetical protein